MQQVQDRFEQSSVLSSQNCKLSFRKYFSSPKENISINIPGFQPPRPITSGPDYFGKQLFAQLPKIQNSITTMGVRIRGLSIENPAMAFIRRNEYLRHYINLVGQKP